MKNTPIWKRYRTFWGRNVNTDLEDELGFHLEGRAQELIEQGWDPGSARQEAQRLFGKRSMPTVQVLSESTSVFETLRTHLLRSKVQGPAIHDARIATICLNHGVRKLLTADRDFNRFPDLRTGNPRVG